MPNNKRGNGQGRRTNWNSDKPRYNEHDNRGERGGGGNVRRVSFKQGGHQKNNFNNKFKKINFESIFDDDIDMAGGSGFNKQRGGKHSTMGRFKSSPGYYNGPTFEPGPCPWYQITIPYGAKHTKELLLKSLLLHISPVVFIPYYYKKSGEAAIFYVDDVKVAEKLFYTSKKVSMPDGFKLIIKIRNMMPKCEFSEEHKKMIKAAMAKRYNPATRALDLTKFYADPELLDMFVPLFRPQIMMAVIDVIEQNIPELEALNLNDNKLHIIDHMKNMSSKLRNLKILYIGDNKIQNVSMLDALKGLPLVELVIKGNPMTTKFRDPAQLVSEVRKRFPKLLKLDGVDLPPTIGFDGDDDTGNIPQRQQSFLVNPQGQDLIREFLTQYFAIYDSDSRQALLDAYHEKAMFSMNACNYKDDEAKHNNKRLATYFNNSRNILRLTERNIRRRTLKVGKLQVVSLIEDFPKTEHHLQGFSVDLVVFMPTIITLTINGVFRERTSNIEPKPLRAFHRTMVIVPNNNGYCILNDMLFITNCNEQQERAAFRDPEPVVVAPAVAAPVAASENPELQKQQLATTLSQHTGMNLHWSANCLQETSWDYQRAMFIFTQLKEQGKIPPEAFIQ